MAVVKVVLFYAFIASFGAGLGAGMYFVAQIGDGFCDGDGGPQCATSSASTASR